MTAEAIKPYLLHLEIKPIRKEPDKEELKKIDVVMEESSTDFYVQYLQQMARIMKSQLRYGVPVPRKSFFGQLRSKLEISRIRERTKKDYEKALDVLEGRSDKKIIIWKLNEEIIAFQIMDTLQVGRKIAKT